MSAIPVPKEVLQRAYVRKLNPFIKLPFFYGMVAALGYAGWWACNHLRHGVVLGVVSGVFIGMLVRGLGSIGHDGVHGVVSKNRFVNYVMGFLGWSATLMSYSIYRTYHLDHHRIVCQPSDIDRVQPSMWTRSAGVSRLYRVAIYMGGYPIYWALRVGRYLREMPWYLHLRMYAEFVFLYGGLVGLYFVMGAVPFIAIVGTQTVTGAFFASATSMCEHFGMRYHPDPGFSSRTYAIKSWFANFLWSGTNFHHEHHTWPGIPYYNLRSFHFEARPFYPPEVQAHMHDYFWPLAFELWGQAAKVDPNEERANAQADEAMLAQASAA